MKPNRTESGPCTRRTFSAIPAGADNAKANEGMLTNPVDKGSCTSQRRTSFDLGLFARSSRFPADLGLATIYGTAQIRPRKALRAGSLLMPMEASADSTPGMVTFDIGAGKFTANETTRERSNLCILLDGKEQAFRKGQDSSRRHERGQHQETCPLHVE